MDKKKNIKIFVAYHKDAQRMKSDILTPIHVGRALASDENKECLKDMIGDDTGDNISSKNPNYCELTALYWAWKNCDADYVGFMHYRRHFNFLENKKYKESKWGIIEESIINDDYLKKYGVTDSCIYDVVDKNDIIIPCGWNVKNAKSKNNYDHYKNSSDFLHISDYDRALNILLSKRPEYKKAVEKYNNSNYGIYTNMFVMKKELFKEYASWLFDILFELESQIDISSYNTAEARIYGYISEWLTGIFITHKSLNSNMKIKELQRTFVQNTSLRKNVIPVCFSSDNNYFMPLYVAVYSLLSNKNPEDFYEINVIDGGITDKNKKMLYDLKNQFDFDVKFIEIDRDLFEQCPLDDHNHITIATYYRFLLASLFKNHEKIIYIDCDLIVRKSLAALYSIDMNDNYIGGVKDILCEQNTKRLNLQRYVNAGVLLVNLKKWRQDSVEEKLFDYTVNQKERIVWGDQDVLNDVLQEGIVYIDEKWNLQASSFVDFDYPDYLKNNDDVSIIHFITSDKPWQCASVQSLRKCFYKVLKKTPYKNVYVKCLIADIFKFLFYFRKGEIKELQIIGVSIFKRTKKNNRKHLKILNLFNIEKAC